MMIFKNLLDIMKRLTTQPEQPELVSPIPKGMRQEDFFNTKTPEITPVSPSPQPQTKAQSLGISPQELEGWIPQSPETTIDLRQGGQPQLPPAKLPPAQVQGATNGNINFKQLIEVAKAKAEAQGFHPAPVVSQMASESKRGTSPFAKERNNMFGVGAFDNDLDNTHRYGSPEESIDAYLELISTAPRYSKAYEQRQDPAKYIQAVKDAGYATDPNYVWTIMNTPEWRSMM